MLQPFGSLEIPEVGGLLDLVLKNSAKLVRTINGRQN
jgi:hypothetical protein